MTPSESWAYVERQTAKFEDSFLPCLLELRARVETLEAKYETMRLATLEWGEDVDKVKRWSDQHLQRIMKLEAAQQQPEPIDEEENDRRFHACMKLIRNATPEQIRAAAGLPERSPLVERVTDAIVEEATCAGIVNDRPARAAIREVATWMTSNPDVYFPPALVFALEQEAER